MPDEIAHEFPYDPALPVTKEERLVGRHNTYLELGRVFTPLIFMLGDELTFSAPLNNNQIEKFDYKAIRGNFNLGNAKIRTIDNTLLPRFDQCLGLQVAPELPMGLEIIVPIGAHGEKWAMASILATRAIYSLIYENEQIRRKANIIQVREKGLIEMSTFQMDPFHTLIEGAQTQVALLSLLMADRVEGADNPLELYEEIIKGDLIKRAAKRFQLGVVFPLVGLGHYLPEPLVRNSHEELVFSEDLKEFWKKEKEAALRSDLDLLALTEGCPVARSGVIGQNGQKFPVSGITEFSRITAPYFRFFYNQLGN